MIEREPYRPGLVRNQNLVEQLRELQKNPRSLVFVALAENYRGESLPHQALEILEEGLAFYPGLASALIVKARCLFDLRRFAEAAVVCREILAANGGNIKAQKLLAQIYVRLGQRKAAIRALARVLTLFPQDREAAKALAELENLENGERIQPERAAPLVSGPAPALGRIDDFQVGSFREALASLPEESAAPMSTSPVTAREVVTVPEMVIEPEGEDEGPEPTFATRTIAELYLRQGLKRKAIKCCVKFCRKTPPMRGPEKPCKTLDLME